MRTPNTCSPHPVALWYIGSEHAPEGRALQLKQLTQQLHLLVNSYVRRAEHMVEVIPKLAQLIAPPGFKADALVVESQPHPAPSQQGQQHCAISTTQTGAVRNLKRSSTKRESTVEIIDKHNLR